MPRNPAHPWVGEAVVLDWANPIAGAPFTDDGDAIRYRGRDSDTVTLTAGDSFIAGFFDSESLLTGDAAVFTFALVTAAGSSGTLVLSGGVDPDWSLDDPGDATQALGTHAVTGAGTVVSDPLTRDVDDYLAQADETILYVQCTAGTVVLEQVKLRIWPPGGPVGGWVDAPGFTVEQAPSVWVGAGGRDVGPTPTQTGGDPATEFAAAAADLVDAWTGTAAPLAPRSTWIAATEAEAVLSSNVGVATLDVSEPYVYDAAGLAEAPVSVAQQPDPVNVARVNTPNVPGTTYGLDLTWPPDEVPGDVGVQFDTAPSVAWGTVTLDPATGFWTLIDTGMGYSVTVIDDDATVFSTSSSGIEPPTDYAVSLPSSPPSPGPVTMPDARTVLFSMSADFLLEAATYAGSGVGMAANYATEATAGVNFAFEDSVVTVPPYRYWSPDAGVVPPMRLMQRGDGLGMGSGSLLGVSTRQGSSRLLGSY